MKPFPLTKPIEVQGSGNAGTRHSHRFLVVILKKKEKWTFSTKPHMNEHFAVVHLFWKKLQNTMFYMVFATRDLNDKDLNYCFTIDNNWRIWLHN